MNKLNVTMGGVLVFVVLCVLASPLPAKAPPPTRDSEARVGGRVVPLVQTVPNAMTEKEVIELIKRNKKDLQPSGGDHC